MTRRKRSGLRTSWLLLLIPRFKMKYKISESFIDMAEHLEDRDSITSPSFVKQEIIDWYSYECD
jgi:hypothetical protein